MKMKVFFFSRTEAQLYLVKDPLLCKRPSNVTIKARANDDIHAPVWGFAYLRFNPSSTSPSGGFVVNEP